MSLESKKYLTFRSFINKCLFQIKLDRIWRYRDSSHLKNPHKSFRAGKRKEGKEEFFVGTVFSRIEIQKKNSLRIYMGNHKIFDMSVSGKFSLKSGIPDKFEVFSTPGITPAFFKFNLQG